MRARKMKTFKPTDRIKSKNGAKRILKNAKRLSKIILSLETIPDIRDKVDKLESDYRIAMHNSAGDDKLYVSINENAVNIFSKIANYVRIQFGPGELLSRIERYKARYVPIS